MENDDEKPIVGDKPLSTSCPHCPAHTAKPISVITDKDDPNIVNVKMQCQDCLHSWIVPKLLHDELPA